MESTYGDRRHEGGDGGERLASAIRETVDAGGVALIPAFAVDRTELILLHLRRLVRSGEIPELPVYVDSPMALEALGVYRRAIADSAPGVRPELSGDGDPFDPGNLIEARSVEASKAINDERGPAIIVSASGMATGGRVLHHLARRLPDARNRVLLVGFQAAQTRGAKLLAGARTLKMLGRYVPVRARIVDLCDFSVHADRAEILDWLRSAPAEPGITTWSTARRPPRSRCASTWSASSDGAPWSRASASACAWTRRRRAAVRTQSATADGTSASRAAMLPALTTASHAPRTRARRRDMRLARSAGARPGSTSSATTGRAPSASSSSTPRPATQRVRASTTRRKP